VSERLDYMPRRARVLVLEDEDDLEGLIDAWLARHGLKTVPIRGGSGRATSPGRAPGAPGAAGIGVVDPLWERLEAEMLDRGSPTFLIVAEPVEDASDTDAPPSVDIVQPHGGSPSTTYADLDAWVDSLQAGVHSDEGHIRLGPLDISSARRSVRVLDSNVHLTPTEFRLLCYLAEHADRVVGHAELLHSVWGAGYEDDIHLLQVTIRSLRARMELATDRPVIESVYGVGYRMAVWPVENAPS
jgi:two-component system KDP operon response regulator KdpE